ANGAGVLVGIALKSGSGPGGGSPKVLLIAPPKVGKLTEFAEMFEGATEKSEKFSYHYRKTADEYGCEFLDASEVVTSSNINGIHLELSEHQKLGKRVATLVKRILK
ncbi:hydrolase, partial [Candidatus Aerophobetes bacterium]